MQPGQTVDAHNDVSFEGMLAGMDAALEWIRSLEVPLGAGSRYLRYRELLAQLVIDYKNPTWTGSKEHLLRYWSAAYEAADIGVIHRAFTGLVPTIPGLLERLREVVRGPEQIAHERPGNAGARARNTAFELVVGARIQKAGFPVRFDYRADVLFQVDGQALAVECKRPMSGTAMRGNIATAVEQGQTAVANGEAASFFIAVEASPAVNRGNPLLSATAPMAQVLEQLSDGIAGALDHDLPKPWPPEMIGVLGRFSGLIVDREKNIPVYAQQWAMIGTRDTDPDRAALSQKVVKALQQATAVKAVIDGA
jgi:hypothetical protein